MALRIEKAFGPDMDHLLRMQLAYDVAKTREHARGIAINGYAGLKPHIGSTRNPSFICATRAGVASPVLLGPQPFRNRQDLEPCP